MKANKPDFNGINRMIEMLQGLEQSFLEMFEGIGLLEEEAKEACNKYLLAKATDALEDFSVEELKNSNMPIRIPLLLNAGYVTLKDLYTASDWELLAISGIGEKQLSSIRFLTEEFRQAIAGRQRISLRLDELDSTSREIVTKTGRILNAYPVVQEARLISEEIHARIEKVTEGVTIRSGLRWFFSTSKTKEASLQAVGDMIAFCDSPLHDRMCNFITLYQKACSMNEAEAVENFRKHSASYYAWFEKNAGTKDKASFVYENIPLQLALEINNEHLDLTGFKGTLRSYQEFGTRYILHQKKVLLGDEMGLGKTVQAIAAMAHLNRKSPDCYFLVVCPASVLINWIREIHQFSGIGCFLLHGSSMENNLEKWKEHGGIAVTNYESMRPVAQFIDNSVILALLVIDEAHYIKNPQAKRTQMVHKLEEEAERILLMTGTPLENRVGEMCELIRFVRPDLEEGIKQKAQIRSLPEFREMLAPVYLRRKREQVLTELPPVTEQLEWCAMTLEDQDSYRQQLYDKNFMGMRRISFLQADLTHSSKAVRLLELCDEAGREGRKVIVFSFFRETVQKVQILLAEKCVGSITGSDTVEKRQSTIDGFTDAPEGSILVCQIQAGGVGLNLQTASVVIFCEPQIKPSLVSQAVSRVHRMGQTESTLVFHLLCEGTVDESMMLLQEKKQEEFDLFADESVIADAIDNLPDPAWIRQVIDEQRQKYLPVVYDEKCNITGKNQTEKNSGV